MYKIDAMIFVLKIEYYTGANNERIPRAATDEVTAREIN